MLCVFFLKIQEACFGKHFVECKNNVTVFIDVSVYLDQLKMSVADSFPTSKIDKYFFCRLCIYIYVIE